MEKLMDILKGLKPEIDFGTNQHLMDDGILDSLDIVEIIEQIEEAYQIKINPNRIDSDNFESAKVMWKMIQDIKGYSE